MQSLLGISTGQDSISVQAYLVPEDKENPPENTADESNTTALNELLTKKTTEQIFGGGQDPEWEPEDEHPKDNHLLFPCHMWQEAENNYGVRKCALKVDVLLNNELGYSKAIGSIQLNLDDHTIAGSALTAKSHPYNLDSSGILHCSVYYSSNYIYTVRGDADAATDAASSFFSLASISPTR